MARCAAEIGCIAVAIAGCGGQHAQKLPSVCIQGPGVVLKALANAPGSVAMNGTPISGCFNRDASGVDAQIVGTNLLAAAQQLGDRAHAGNRRAALQLGYLVGAARRGAKRSGLGAEMVRRLEAEAAADGGPDGPYDRGLRAGLSGG